MLSANFADENQCTPVSGIVVKELDLPQSAVTNGCALCHSILTSKKFTVNETMFLTGQTFDYTQCGNCESLNREKFNFDLSALYPDNYYSLSPDPVEIFSKFIPHYLARMMAHSALRGKILFLVLIQNLAPKREVRTLASIMISISRTKKESSWGRILDVGTGSGVVPFVLGLSHSESVLGIDPFATPKGDVTATHAEQTDIHSISGEFDLIMFNHSLEHVDDIESTLITATKRLAFDGRIIIRIPTVSSYAWRTYAESWYQIDAPRHSSIPSRRGLQLLAERCGLSIIYTYDDSTETQFWISEHVKQGLSTMDSASGLLRSASQSHFKLFRFKLQAKKLNLLRDGDQTAIILKRIF